MNVDPTAEQIAEMTLLAADAVRGFGMTPKAALLSHSNFGASDRRVARKMRQALGLIRERAPGPGDRRRDARRRRAGRGDPRPRGAGQPADRRRQLLIMPTLDAANIAFNLLKAAADGLPVGPMLLGMSKPIHVVVPSATARGILNVSAIAVVQAQALAAGARGD